MERILKSHIDEIDKVKANALNRNEYCSPSFGEEMSFEMRWDLSVFVKNVNPEKIKSELDSMVRAANVIRDIYSGQVKTMEALGVRQLLESLDSFILEFDGVLGYCGLRYAADSTDVMAKQLNDAMRNAWVRAGQALAFAEVELGELLLMKPELITHPELRNYRHYLERALSRAPHLLSEREEQLIMAKDRNGIGAWSQLHGDWLGTRTFRMRIDGIDKDVTYGEAVGYFTSPDRKTRKSAFSAVLEGLGKDEMVFASALRAVSADHLAMCEWRKYPGPMTQSLLSNDIGEEAITAMMSVVEKNVHLYRRYLRVKAKLLGLERLGGWDLMAPLPFASNSSYDWATSRAMVTEAYSDFDPEFGRWVTEMFDSRRIDGEVRKGKTPGAFCSTWMAGKSAFILQSYNNRINDVYIQAHELGHAMHAYLYTREQSPANCDIGSCLAECGSAFGELLLTEKLIAKANNKEDRQVALATVLDELGIAVFLVGARYWFEVSLYGAIERGELLDGEALSKLWTESRERLFADELEWMPEMRFDWTRPPHYYMPNYRFYNYPYIFAQLFVFALYRLYKEQGKSFVPKLRVLLAAGSSRSPSELGKELGFDIASEAFWQKGMLQAEEFLRMLEETL
jgi:oligoendopeptidase F